MSLEKKIKSTVLQKIGHLILGRYRPSLIIQVSVIIGFISWLILVFGHLITFFSVTLFPKLEQSNIIRDAYNRVGYVQYGFRNTVQLLFVHSTFQIVVYLLALIGLILIWRQKNSGFVIYTLSLIGSILVSFFLMHVGYLIAEISIFKYFLLIGNIVYFGIGYFLFYRQKISLV
ncbi:MAG: hypothetical protein IT222_03545 [Crocinitomix sp.]|nr:hypothetical protein [Crocinitomix sp.]